MSIYCASDWHGCYWVWEKVKKILKPNDKLYFLGDAADRGPDGWNIIKELLADPRVIYIKGNHEDLMIEAIGKFNPEEEDSLWNADTTLWHYNGGDPTYDAFLLDEDDFGKAKILKQIKDLPFCANYINKNNQQVFLCHAGCDGVDIDTLDEYHAIWDREHWRFPDEWSGEDNQIIVHGHTPIDLMIEEQRDIASFYKNRFKVEMPKWTPGTAYWYAKGHKVCIDLGTVWDKVAVLLNLDTFEEVYINEKYV